MQNPKINWKYILCFYGIAFVLSVPANSFYFLEQWQQLTKGTVLYAMPFLLAGLGTLMAALLAFRFDKGRGQAISLFGNNRVKNMVITILPLPVITAAGMPNHLGLDTHLYALLIGLVSLVYAFTEEIFWRGYLVNALAPLGWAKNYFITGLLWWAWHFNFMGSYAYTTFLPLVVLSSFLIGKFVEGTRSYLTAAGLHALIVMLTVGGNSRPLLYAGGSVILGWVLIGSFWKSGSDNRPFEDS